MKCRLKQRVMRLAAHALLMNVMGLSQLAKATENNVHLTGALVAQPCVIPPGEENIPVEFGTVVDKYLYANERTKSEEFAIHLTECDPDVAQRVKVTFGGTPNTALPGLLALDGGSEAKGVALGLETEDGTALVLNENTTAVLVTEGKCSCAIVRMCKGSQRQLPLTASGWVNSGQRRHLVWSMNKLFILFTSVLTIFNN
ncbi:fimbrial protein [Enterobacter cancerogenus]|uniref:Fimbrial protein n=1 Tax=Enterobacter cancerogenus TaxID=69218 RepID=A0A484WVM4_9ENTR|nr:fimbrial protein [Enterobacter cancerogenus]